MALCWLRGASTEAAAEGARLVFHRLPGHELDIEAHSTLFTGEQSNSSVAFGEDALLKVFRKVTPGVNPDIAIHQVLTEAGSTTSPRSTAGWTSSTRAPTTTLQLAMLQQFLRTASDGWDLALASVRNLFAEADLHADEVGGDFAGEAARLGEALAEVHPTLAEHFPVERREADALGELADAMDGRLDAALDVVPDLAPHAERPARDVRRGCARSTACEVQQVHGDLHLGQTLRTVKGWKIVDFEGEPAKPLAERLLPDSPWRDVGGHAPLLRLRPARGRAHLGADAGGEAEQRAYRAAEWAERNRAAFLDRLRRRASRRADEQVLLEAYVADKAVYEAVYETRNRPTWVRIPLERRREDRSVMTSTPRARPSPPTSSTMLVAGRARRTRTRSSARTPTAAASPSAR